MIVRLFCWLGWHENDKIVIQGVDNSARPINFCRQCGKGHPRFDKSFK